MTNLIVNWWQSYQLKIALKKSDYRRAENLLSIIQRSATKLSWLERLFKDKLQVEKSLFESEREIKALRRKSDQDYQSFESALASQKRQFEQLLEQQKQEILVEQQKQEILLLQAQLNSLSTQKTLFSLPLNKDLSQSVFESFKLKPKDANLIECTGINEELFNELEIKVSEYLELEFENYGSKNQLKQHLKSTYERDILALKEGKDPQYDSRLSPHVYFMIYFLEGVYSAYIAWFLVYESGLIPLKPNILDIGAGSGAMLYGLFSFLRSAEDFLQFPQVHISYCSLEKQNLLQSHGLKLWRRYIEEQTSSAINTYFQFKTADLFIYGNRDDNLKEMPQDFFDFIVISHCIFYNKDKRVLSHEIYKKIFSNSLKDTGHVLVVVQGGKLFQAYGRTPTEDQTQEKELIQEFVGELGLQLEWYKYITSTGKRTPTRGPEFSKFAKENLPPQNHVSLLSRQYLGRKFDSKYTLDDYIILAKR